MHFSGLTGSEYPGYGVVVQWEVGITLKTLEQLKRCGVLSFELMALPLGRLNNYYGKYASLTGKTIVRRDCFQEDMRAV